MHRAPKPTPPSRVPVQVRFLYDASIFAKDVAYSADVIATRLHELAFLNARATIRFRALRRGKPVRGTSRYLAAAASRRAAAAAAAANGDDGAEGLGSGSGSDGESGAAEVASTSAPSPPPAVSKRGGKKQKGGGDAAAAAAGGAAAPQYGIIREEGQWQVFQYSGGLREFVGCLQAAYTPLHEALVVTRADGGSGVVVEAALQWAADSFKEEVRWRKLCCLLGSVGLWRC